MINKRATIHRSKYSLQSRNNFFKTNYFHNDYFKSNDGYVSHKRKELTQRWLRIMNRARDGLWNDFLALISFCKRLEIQSDFIMDIQTLQ